MTEQTKRALERLPKDFCYEMICHGGATDEQEKAAEELAARSPELLELLDEVLVIASVWEMRGSNWSSEEAAANSTALAEARALLRETTRAMLGGDA